jgi:hypothetical protein
MRALMVAIAAWTLSGCASVTYIDSHNVTHVVGLVDVELEPAATAQRSPVLVAATTLGIALKMAGAPNDGLALGYSRDLMMSIPNNACIDIGKPGPCNRLASD